MGADTIALMAATYPHLVRTVVLEDPPWKIDDSPSVKSRAASVGEWQERLQEQKAQPYEALVARARRQHPHWADSEFGPWAQAKRQVSPQALQLISEFRPHWRETVATITCSSLLLTGDPELGALVTPEVAAEVTRRSPCFQVAHLEGAGHNIRREQFEPFIHHVTAFLAKL